MHARRHSAVSVRRCWPAPFLSARRVIQASIQQRNFFLSLLLCLKKCVTQGRKGRQRTAAARGNAACWNRFRDVNKEGLFRGDVWSVWRATARGEREPAGRRNRSWRLDSYWNPQCWISSQVLKTGKSDISIIWTTWITNGVCAPWDVSIVRSPCRATTQTAAWKQPTREHSLE